MTEAEWEYVARAGSAKTFAFGSSIVADQANFKLTDGSDRGNREEVGDRAGTLPAGSFQAKAFGAYDAHGNVWE